MNVYNDIDIIGNNQALFFSRPNFLFLEQDHIEYNFVLNFSQHPL